jgi:hypothetical protein
MVSFLTARVTAVMPTAVDSLSEDECLPQPGTTGVRVSSCPTLLFIQVGSLVVTLALTHCPVQGLSGCSGRADGHHRVAGAAPGARERTG